MRGLSSFYGGAVTVKLLDRLMLPESWSFISHFQYQKRRCLSSIDLRPPSLKVDFDELTHDVVMTETPFLNRQREIVELGLNNAHFVHRVRKTKHMHNWRSCQFVFAAQMYGAGKPDSEGSSFSKLPSC